MKKAVKREDKKKNQIYKDLKRIIMSTIFMCVFVLAPAKDSQCGMDKKKKEDPVLTAYVSLSKCHIKYYSGFDDEFFMRNFSVCHLETGFSSFRGYDKRGHFFFALFVCVCVCMRGEK